MKKRIVAPTTERAAMIPAECDRLLDTKETAVLLKVKPGTLTCARVHGTASYPPYLKIGKSVRYRLSTVLHWLDALPEHQHTSSQAA